MINIINVSKEYNLGANSFLALDKINLNINTGDFVSIMGSSGSGKSTLMNIIGCLDVPSSGDYELNKNNISKLSSNELATIRNKKIGFIALGGINSLNIKKINLLNCYGFAGINWIKKNGLRKLRPFLNCLNLQ